MNNVATSGAGVTTAIDSPAIVQDCVFLNNTATIGTGVEIVGCPTIVRRCVFQDNQASFGAGISVTQESTAQVIDCTFTGNSAGNGGAIYVLSAYPTIVGADFSNNSAIYSGGAANLDDSNVEFLRCTFTNNTAVTGGGVSCITDGVTHLQLCTVSGNSATFGANVAVFDVCQPVIDHTILSFGSVGPAISCANGPPLVTCCDVYGNAGGDWVGCIASQLGANGNFSSDPLFCGSYSPDEPYTLWAGSPCAPGGSPTCGLNGIGAWPVGCNPLSAVHNPRPGHGSTEPGSDSISRLLLKGGLAVVPNPSSGPCRFYFDVTGASSVVLEILDASGRAVLQKMVEARSAGRLAVTWDGRDDRGREVGAGVYFARIQGAQAARGTTLLRVRE